MTQGSGSSEHQRHIIISFVIGLRRAAQPSRAQPQIRSATLAGNRFA